MRGGPLEVSPLSSFCGTNKTKQNKKNYTREGRLKQRKRKGTDLENSKAEAAETEEVDLEREETENSKLQADASCQDGGRVCGVCPAGSILG